MRTIRNPDMRVKFAPDPLPKITPAVQREIGRLVAAMRIQAELRVYDAMGVPRPWPFSQYHQPH